VFTLLIGFARISESSPWPVGGGQLPPFGTPVATLMPRAVHVQDHPDVQGKLGCSRLEFGIGDSAKNGTLQSDVDISGERDQRYGRPPPKHSDDDDDDDVCL